MADIFTI